MAVKREVEAYVPPTEEVFTLPLLSEKEGKTFFIERVEFDESVKGEYAVLDVLDSLDQEKPKLYRTSAKALINQLKSIRKRIIDNGRVQQVKLGKAKGETYDYLTFVEV